MASYSDILFEFEKRVLELPDDHELRKNWLFVHTMLEKIIEDNCFAKAIHDLKKNGNDPMLLQVISLLQARSQESRK